MHQIACYLMHRHKHDSGEDERRAKEQWEVIQSVSTKKAEQTKQREPEWKENHELLKKCLFKEESDKVCHECGKKDPKEWIRRHCSCCTYVVHWCVNHSLIKETLTAITRKQELGWSVYLEDNELTTKRRALMLLMKSKRETEEEFGEMPECKLEFVWGKLRITRTGTKSQQGFLMKIWEIRFNFMLMTRKDRSLVDGIGGMIFGETNLLRV